MKKDLTKIDQAIKMLTSIYEHRKAHPTSESETLWYKFYVEALKKAKAIWEQDEFLAGVMEFVPAEICYAMDIPSIGLAVYGPGAITVCGKLEEQCLNAARQTGLLLETCSGWRMIVGLVARDWFPKLGAVVACSPTCDTCNKCGAIVANMQDIPVFLLDVPFPASDPKNLGYVREELADLVSFLENISNRKMNWDKLRESVDMSRKMVNLNLEIWNLLKARPSPISTRMSAQSYWINWVYSGRPEGIAFLTGLRNELKGRVEKGLAGTKGKEKYRILAIPPSPQSRGKTMDWLAREYGVVTAASSFMMWKDFEIDSEDPLMGVTQKLLNNPIIRQYYNPAESEEGIVTDTLKAVEALSLDGVIIWGNPACDATCGFVKILKDRLEDIDIPLVLLDHDPADLSYTPEDTLKERLVEFVDLME